jgi:hypothetical protein
MLSTGHTDESVAFRCGYLTRVTFFNNGSKSDPTKLFRSIVLVIVGEKRFPPPNFNLKIVRIQCGGGSWMLLDALLHC